MSGRPARSARGEAGQILPLLAVGLLAVLLALGGAVVDVGHAYLAKRRLQGIADAVALAAAASLPSVTQAASVGASFGPAGKNPAPGLAVTQTLTPVCLKSIGYCYGNGPGTVPQNGRANGVVVTEEAEVETTFSKVLGIGAFHVRATATACGMCGARPLDIALVLDRTGSMSDDMDVLRAGVKTFLQALDPELDWVSLLVLPPAPAGDACAAPPGRTGFPLASGNSYPLGSDGSYRVVHLSNDYENADGTLNPDSALVRAVDCLEAAGSTSYQQALAAAQEELVQHGSGRPNLQRVIVFESDGAANTAPDSSFDRSAQTASYGSQTVYQPLASRSAEVLRPCGSAVDYANGIKPVGDGDGTIVFTVGYAVQRDDGCYQAPHAYRTRFGLGAAGYKTDPEGMSATDALAQIASPGDAVAQATAGDLRESFAEIANKVLGSSLVPDSEAP